MMKTRKHDLKKVREMIREEKELRIERLNEFA